MWQPPSGHGSQSAPPVVLQMPPPRPFAVFLAGKVANHARKIKNIHEEKMWCTDCKMFPKGPVTGRCGHTRCIICIKRNGACPCGALQPESLVINILVRDLIEKMMSRHINIRIGGGLSSNMLASNESESSNMLASNESECSLIPSASLGKIRKYAHRSRMRRIQPKMHLTQSRHQEISPHHMFTCPQVRFQYARELFRSGNYLDSGGHLAHVAGSSDPAAKLAHDLLAQVISVQSRSQDLRRLLRSLYKSVHQQTVTAWIDPSNIECPICYDVMEHPVTTTCGHTFCRCCIKRTLESRIVCPLCSTSLYHFNLAQTEDTEFLCAVMRTITPKVQIDPDCIPIFACTVAFPDIPCPLMIFDADFRNVIKGVLDSGSRKFGMLAILGDESYANFGTVVEVRDCVLFEDGKSILSTVGVSRFHVIEKVKINGYSYARIQEHADIIPTVEINIFSLKLLAHQIKFKVQEWLSSLGVALRTDIVTNFGPFPEINLDGEWWDTANGPTWLWWLIAVLPLKIEIQMLMLSTKYLVKRMTAVLRTLDAMDFYSYEY